jgi:sulfatase modifying factor 1
LYRSAKVLSLYNACQRRSLLAVAASAVLAFLPFGSIANAGVIEWVTVGDPGNTADTGGYGDVSTSFLIMKYEFTNQHYTNFLNSVAATTDPYSLYNVGMGSGAGGISFDPLAASGSKYAVRSNMGDKPVSNVSWFDAARVSNWLMNGATSSSSTETGAYTLVSGQISGTAPAVNPGATFYVPSDDQWYKAAFYKGAGTNAGYWEYATQVTGTAPTAVNATPTGNGTSGGVSPLTTGNFANWNRDADWNSLDGNTTTVGTNGGPSAYGTFDMSGNMFEWNDLTGAAGSLRAIRGGGWSWFRSDFLSSDFIYSLDAATEAEDIGFRLASPVSGPSGVPEIDPATGGSALSLVAGVLAMIEQRRRRATLVA